MVIRNQIILKNNLMLKKYLREHSYYYKELNRNPDFIYTLNSEMKESYKLTLPNKLDRIKDNVNMLTTFMDIIK